MNWFLNIWKKKQEFETTHNNPPIYLCLDTESWRQLRFEMGQNLSSSGKHIILGLEVVVIDKIPELFYIAAEPDIELRKREIREINEFNAPMMERET